MTESALIYFILAILGTEVANYFTSREVLTTPDSRLINAVTFLEISIYLALTGLSIVSKIPNPIIFGTGWLTLGLILGRALLQVTRFSQEDFIRVLFLLSFTLAESILLFELIGTFI